MTRHLLAPDALRAARWNDAIATVVVIVVVLVIGFAIPSLVGWRWLAVVVAAGVALVGALEIFFLEPRAHRAFGYQMRSRAIEISSGVLVRRHRHVPYLQILIVERRAGPIMRRLGIVTARLTLPDRFVDIPGISELAFEALEHAVESGHAHA